MKRILPTSAFSRIAVVLVVLFVAVSAVAMVEIALPATPQQKLEVGIQTYKSANYDDAIRLLTEVVNDESSGIEERKEALRYLGRCYVAKRLTEKAKSSILDLLELEPPIIDFDPDRESPPMMKIYYEARKDHSDGSYAVERKDPGVQTMAILDFKNRSIDDKEKYDPMEMGFADIMISNLNGSTDLKVVERERIQWILEELAIQDKYSMEGAVRAGKQLGVHVVLFGSFIHLKKELWLSARLVKVETSEILFTADVKGKVDKFFDLSEQLSKMVAEKIDTDIKFAEKSDVEEDSNSLEAMLAYSEGLQLLEEDNFESAYQKFQEALTFDPNYKRAELKAESIKGLMAYSEGP